MPYSDLDHHPDGRSSAAMDLPGFLDDAHPYPGLFSISFSGWVAGAAALARLGAYVGQPDGRLLATTFNAHPQPGFLAPECLYLPGRFRLGGNL